jgi:hypothetical protein
MLVWACAVGLGRPISARSPTRTPRSLPTRTTDTSLYDLAICAFGVATLHFTTEWLVFGSVKLNRGSIGPLLVGSSGMVWALTQRDYYLGRI